MGLASTSSPAPPHCPKAHLFRAFWEGAPALASSETDGTLSALAPKSKTPLSKLVLTRHASRGHPGHTRDTPCPGWPLGRATGAPAPAGRTPCGARGGRGRAAEMFQRDKKKRAEWERNEERMKKKRRGRNAMSSTSTTATFASFTFTIARGILAFGAVGLLF